jgi:hypothetical protein
MKYIKIFEEFENQAGIMPRDEFSNTYQDIRKSIRGTWNYGGGWNDSRGQNGHSEGEGDFETFKSCFDKYVSEGDTEIYKLAVKWSAEYGRIEFIDWLIEKGNIEQGDPVFAQALSWISHSRKIHPDRREEVDEYLRSKM